MADGKVQDAHAWESVARVMDDMQRAASFGPDQSFANFLASSPGSEDEKRWAAGYVEGFNAARKEVVGIVSLAQDARAADQIDGDRAFRLTNGYQALPLHLLRAVKDSNTKLRLNSVVESIAWQPGSAAVHFRHALTGHRQTIRCGQVVITVPLGVLQAGPPLLSMAGCMVWQLYSQNATADETIAKAESSRDSATEWAVTVVRSLALPRVCLPYV
jgi:hypothetical protein